MSRRSFLALAPLLLAFPAAWGNEGAEGFGAFLDERYGKARDLTPAGDTLVLALRANPELEPQIAALARDKATPASLRLHAARALIYFSRAVVSLEDAASALAATPFAITDRTEWLFLCRKIAARGGSVVPCAARILDEPYFEFPLFGSRSKVSKEIAFTMLLLNMPEPMWNRWVGDRLWRGEDTIPTSQRALVSAAMALVSLRSDAIIAKIADDPTRPANLRAAALRALAQIQAMERFAKEGKSEVLRETLGVQDLRDEMLLRSRRRSIASQLSQSNIERLEQITFLIREQAMLRWNELSRQGGI